MVKMSSDVIVRTRTASRLRRAGLMLLGLCCGLLAMGSPSARAGEKYIEFLEGLRNRDYFDLAMLYLEQIEKQPDLPKEIRELLPYEKAMTLQQGVRSIKGADLQTKQLDQAKGFLEEFLKNSPDHALAAQANTELANVYLGKARVEVIQSRSPNNAAQKGEFQKKARVMLGEARKVYQAAHDLYQAKYKAFPVFIDEAKDKSEYEARETALVNFIQAQLNLAIVRYEEAQTYEKTDPQYKKLLTDASVEFEAIHSRYRSQVAGLYARMWQGKCFEEQGDITKALGFYNELLAHPGDSPVMRRLQNRVLHFKLICLNNDQRRDYQLVVNDARDWLKQNATLLRTREGLGIRWEAARASEWLGDKDDTAAKDKDDLYRQALTHAQFINVYPGEYKDASLAMIQRLNAKLNRDGGDPKDFATAFGLARSLIGQTRSKKTELDALTGPARQKAEDEFRKHNLELARMLRLCLGLWTPKEDLNELNRARYWLAYSYYLMKDHNYEAAVLGEFVARGYHAQNPDLALDSAFIAMYSFQQALAQAPADQKEFDIQQMVRIGQFITKTWPTTDKANDARMNLGQMYTRLKRPVDAFTILSEVPETAPQYLEAQLNAGMAYWQAYIDGAVQPEANRPPKEQLDKYQAEALKILKDAITKLESKQPKDAPPEENVSFAKTNLVQILNLSGAYQDAANYLTEGPKSLVVAVKIDQEDKRPPKGIKSRPTAEFVYRELLRSYVGLQQLEKARSAMKDLEKIAGAGGGSTQDVVKIYLDLGRELRKEVERLQAAKDPRLDAVLKSFETFLDDMFARKEGQDYNTLAWVGETYFALGEGLLSGDKTRADGYFSRSATAFSEILNRAESAPDFIPPGGQTGVQLRLVTGKRKQGQFEEALELVRKVLTAKPRAIDAQVEALAVYEDWAKRGQTGDEEKWKLAVEGDKPTKSGEKVIWGWYDLSERLGLSLMSANANPDYENQYLDARYHMASCLKNYAMTQSKEKKEENLDRARKAIIVTTTTADFNDDEWFQKFNLLFREIQEKQFEAGSKSDGVAVTEIQDLERPKKAVPVEKPKPQVASTAALKKSSKAAKPAVKKAPPPPDNTMMYVFVGILVIAAGGFAYTMLSGKKKPRSTTVAASSSAGAGSSGASGGKSGDAPRKRPAAAATPKTKA